MPLLYLTILKILAVLSILGFTYWLFTKLGVRKFYPIPLILCLGLSTYLFSPPKEDSPNTLTPEQQNSIRQEQMHIAAWYTDYKKDIEQMDMIWQQYHKTINSFRNDEISIQTVYLRLFELEKKTNFYKAKYKSPQLPTNLSKENENLLNTIIAKTHHYAEQQDIVLLNSVNRIAPKNLQTQIHFEQLQILDKVMVLESPTNLDISQEIMKIKDNLVIPGEK